jgi:nonsense-mediated mRNA decay protein 3
MNDDNLESIPEASRPDVVIVKKIYGDKSLRNRKRKWRLKHMDGLHAGQVETESQNNDYNEFLEVNAILLGMAWKMSSLIILSHICQ